MSERIAVLGAGSWGTALAIHCGRVGHDVRLWGRDPSLMDDDRAHARERRATCRTSRSPTACSPTASLETALDGAPIVDRRGAVARHARTCCARRAPFLAHGRRSSSARRRGSRRDSLDRMSQVIAEETGRASDRRALRTELRARSRARPADRRRRRVRRMRRRRRACRSSLKGPTFRLYAQRRRDRRRVRRRAEERHRDRRRRRRRTRHRAQRDGGADHARPRRDVAARVRGGQPARNAGRAERPRRSRADVHRRSEPQPPRRHRARPRPPARRHPRARRGWWPKACARPAPRWRSARATASSCRWPRRWRPCSKDGRPRASAVEALMLRPQRSESDHA